MIAALKIPPIKTDLRRVDSKLVAHFQEKTLSDFDKTLYNTFKYFVTFIFNQTYVIRKFTILSPFFLQF